MIVCDDSPPITSSASSSTASCSSDVAVQEETLMKYFSGLIQASFGTALSLKRTNGLTKIHWRVSVRRSKMLQLCSYCCYSDSYPYLTQK